MTRVPRGVVPFLDGLLWRPRLASLYPAPCEASYIASPWRRPSVRGEEPQPT